MVRVSQARARAVAEELRINLATVPLAVWQQALRVELEHGRRFGAATNVTDDDLVATGRIALAHLKEFPDYYQRLARMEAAAERHWAGRRKPPVTIRRAQKKARV